MRNITLMALVFALILVGAVFSAVEQPNQPASVAIGSDTNVGLPGSNTTLIKIDPIRAEQSGGSPGNFANFYIYRNSANDPGGTTVQNSTGFTLIDSRFDSNKIVLFMTYDLGQNTGALYKANEFASYAVLKFGGRATTPIVFLGDLRDQRSMTATRSESGNRRTNLRRT